MRPAIRRPDSLPLDGFPLDTERQIGDASHLRIGETAALRDRVRELISAESRIVLNLADVTYIDSGGLGTLVALYTTAGNAGGAIKLARLTPRVGDLLQVTKLLTVFEVYNSEEEAVQSFRQGAAA